MGRKRYKHTRIMADGPALKQIRIEKRMTVAEFARRTGISRSQVSMIETGQSGASEKSAIEIIAALGVRFEDVFRIVEPVEEEDETPLRQLALSHV